jgi:hypothetical protein
VERYAEQIGDKKQMGDKVESDGERQRGEKR